MMKINLKVGLVMSVALLWAAVSVQAQNIHTATLTWSATSTFNINTGETVPESTTVISSPTGIEWKNANGTTRHSLTLLETNGSWTNVAANGMVTFEVDRSGKRGTVQFSRAAEGLRIRIMLLTDDGQEYYELVISRID